MNARTITLDLHATVTIVCHEAGSEPPHPVNQVMVTFLKETLDMQNKYRLTFIDVDPKTQDLEVTFGPVGAPQTVRVPPTSPLDITVVQDVHVEGFVIAIGENESLRSSPTSFAFDSNDRDPKVPTAPNPVGSVAVTFMQEVPDPVPQPE